MLKLAHHKHTGKLLAHHHTSYRGLGLVLLIVGVFMVCMQQTAQASFMDLTAKISGPIPTIPAVINNPADGQDLTIPDITVSGTCEYMAPSNTVEIRIDDTFAGSAPCQSGGVFNVPITLPPGTHSLLARTVNYTADYGPDSTLIYVTYVPPSLPPSTTPGTSGSGGSGTAAKPRSGSGGCVANTPISIESRQPYLEFGLLLAAHWDVSVSGGCPPYTGVIDWGDGTADRIQITDTEPLTLRHAYAAMRPNYQVTLRLTDSAGQRTKLTVAAVNSANEVLYGGLISPDIPFILTFEGTIIRAYLAYLAILLLVALAWYDSRVRRLRLARAYIFPDPPSARRKRQR